VHIWRKYRFEYFVGHRWHSIDIYLYGFRILLIILNLLFGFATFLQLPRRPDPFSRWSKPGTTSEGLPWYPTDFLRDVIPIPCHSHNDYWRKVPLFSALYNGCISVEADVWAFDDELYIGHNTASLTVNRTFQSLYINPLVTILERQNPATSFYNASGHGVFDTDSEQSLTLLVDVKTDGAETWPLVLQQLEPLRQRGWLSYVENDVMHRRPITVVGTGETPFNVLTSNQTYRDAFFDAPLDQMWEGPRPDEGEPVLPGVDNMGDSTGGSRTDKLTSSIARAKPNNPLSLSTVQRRSQGNAGTSSEDSYTQLNSYYASTSFKEVIGTIWWGKLSNEQMDLIRGQIRGAHHRGLKARYWNTPAWPTSLRNYIWDILAQEGADLLNVDDLEAARSGVW
jgi:hypothetical protein